MNLSRTLMLLAGSWFLSLNPTLRGGDFTPDPAGSSIEVAVRATADNFTAHLDQFVTSIKVDAEGRPQSGSFSWDFKDLHSGNVKRDAEMLHWLDHPHSPAGVFRFEELETHGGQMVLKGTLQMHGITNRLSFPLAISRAGTNLVWESKLELDHRSWGLPKIVKLGILRVNPALNIHFKLAGPVKE